MKSFFEQVYEVVAQIPEGKVATYGQIAELLGHPRHARMVGWAMRVASPELGLPCHRVINKSGAMSPDYVFGGEHIQRTLLENEGVTFKSNGCADLERHLW